MSLLVLRVRTGVVDVLHLATSSHPQQAGVVQLLPSASIGCKNGEQLGRHLQSLTTANGSCSNLRNLAGAAKAVGEVLPSTKGKLTGMAFRFLMQMFSSRVRRLHAFLSDKSARASWWKLVE